MVIFLSVLVLWIVSLCLHEYAHARVAYAGGDDSVVAKGYLTMNPLRYVHPMMSIVVPLIILAIGGVALPGGAVYIDRSRLRSPHWESAVSAAGPAANLVVLILCAVPFWLGLYNPEQELGTLWPTLGVFALFQSFAVILNLLPVPGLDGFGIIAPYLPHTWRRQAYELSNIFFIALILLMMNDNVLSNTLRSAYVALPRALGIPIDLMISGYSQFRSVLR